LAGVLLVVVPRSAGARFGIPYSALSVTLFAILGAAATLLAARIVSAPEEQRSRVQWSRLRWLITLGFVAAAAFLWAWVRTETTQALIIATVILIGLSVAAFYGLVRRVRFLHDRVAPRVGCAITSRPVGAVAALVLCLTAVLWTVGRATLSRARAEAGQRGHSIILIGIDTLRADRTRPTSSSEGSRDLTPNMRALGDRGVVFSRAVAQAPWTLASFASVATGLYPEEHGAVHLTSTLAPSQITLAEILREAGYRTFGIATGEYVAAGAGMAQGFEDFDESQVKDGTTISSNFVSDKAIEWLRDHGRDPFFVFLHYFDPHWLYQNHDGFGYADGYAGPLREPAATMKQSDFQSYLGIPRRGLGREALPPADLDYLRDLYDEDIAYTDAALGRLLHFLDETGLRDSCFVILVADHGEAFLEHGMLGHNNSLYAEEIHVPLAVAGPRVEKGRVVDRPVETRALFSTVLECAGAEPPAGRRYPRSLLALDPREPALVRSAAYTMVLGIGGRRLSEPTQCWWTSLQDDRWKLLKAHLGGQPRLFDLVQDPGETRSCSADNEEVSRRLERELDRLDTEVRQRSPTGPAPEVSEEHKRRLRALGYL
jgi:arylsulfatase A-like enzyme